jgi:DDE superfamily endonuclease
MQAGPDAPRFPDHVQRAFYNRWAKKHGLKKQSCSLANGMSLDVCVGFSCRRNDLHLLRESDLNNRMTVLTADEPLVNKYQLYGDSAYVVMQSITSSDDEEAFEYIKAGINSCRESIEWMYRDLKIM